MPSPQPRRAPTGVASRPGALLTLKVSTPGNLTPWVGKPIVHLGLRRPGVSAGDTMRPSLSGRK